MMKLNKKVFYGGVAGALLTVIVLVSVLVFQPGLAGAKSAAPENNRNPLPAASLVSGLYPANHFKIEIEGVNTLDNNFWYISGLEWKSEVQTMIETQANGKIERKNAGIVHHAPDGITIRGVYHDAVRNWFESYHEGSTGKRAMSIVLFDETGVELMRYNCFGVWPSSYKMGPLSTGGAPGLANEEVILQEEFVLQVEEIKKG